MLTRLLLLVALLPSTWSLAAPDAAAELKAAETAFARAFAERSAARFAEFVLEDAVFLDAEGPLEGRKAVMAVWSRYLEAKEPPFSWKADRVAVNAAGTIGFSTGPVFDPKGTRIAVFTSVWVKQKDGSWKIQFDGPGCAVPPPPAQPATPPAAMPKESAPSRPIDLVEVASLDPTVKLDVRYATADNFVKRPVYPEARVFLQRPAAEALVRVHRALAESGYGLLLFDGYRPWSVTKLFWDLTPEKDRIYVADPAKGSRHNRGCAIDLTLYDRKSGAAVAMPSGYDEPSPRSWVTFDQGDAKARERRDLLVAAMEKEGFTVYPWEWWHFDYKDWRDYPIADLSFAAVAALPRTAAYTDALDLKTARVVDLTWPLDERTIYWPNAPSGFVKKSDAFGKTPGGWFYSSNTICTPEHGGTHFDAPVHFGEGKRPTADVPVRQLVGPAVVIDVAAKAAKDPDYRLTVDDVKAWEARNGRIPRGSLVLLRTGWGSRYPDRKSYLGDDTPGRTTSLHFPSYGLESARFLIAERGVGVLGVDTASIDHGPSADFVVHQLAASAEVAGLESLANLGELPESGAYVVALPMKIGGGSGGPLRAVAVLPR